MWFSRLPSPFHQNWTGFVEPILNGFWCQSGRSRSQGLVLEEDPSTFFNGGNFGSKANPLFPKTTTGTMEEFNYIWPSFMVNVSKYLSFWKTKRHNGGFLFFFPWLTCFWTCRLYHITRMIKHWLDQWKKDDPASNDLKSLCATRWYWEISSRPPVFHGLELDLWI